MKRFSWTWLSIAVLSLLTSVACAAGPVTMTITVTGPFTEKSAMALAQQVFVNLAPATVAVLDPTSGVQPYYFTLENDGSLKLYFRVNTSASS